MKGCELGVNAANHRNPMDMRRISSIFSIHAKFAALRHFVILAPGYNTKVKVNKW